MGMGPAGVTLSWNEVWPERKRAMPAVEMQVNMEFAFMFILSMRSATAPPHQRARHCRRWKRWPATRLSDRSGKTEKQAGERSWH